jgi:glycosyltransferase involved in cell wall biosynthesis/phospholipid N-methyltransferase
MLSLSVLVPVYNEQHLVTTSLARIQELGHSDRLSKVQVIVVDDCSKDGTSAALSMFRAERGIEGDGPVADPAVPKIEWLFLRHEQNGGKGQAIRTAVQHASCDVSVIHDSDLEYHPRDLLKFVPVFEDEGADAVFGSRFAGSAVRRVLFYRHELGNRLLTLLTNVVTDLNVTDMETCYKAVRTDLLKSIPLVSNDFRIEPELTIKLAKRGARLFEVPIRYSGRTYKEGKKIGWKDGVKALAAIGRFAMTDNIFAADEYGSQTLARLSRAPRFNAWMADTIAPYCGQRILEIGSGVGNLTCQLLPRTSYFATDINPQYIATLRTLEPDRPYLKTAFCDVTDARSFPSPDGKFDTVICLNVVEHIRDDVGALKNIADALAESGRAIVLVPNGPRMYGTLDEVLGHERRYDPETLREVATRAGLVVEALLPFNRVGSAAWWLNGKVLRRRYFGLAQVKMLNLLTPLFRAVDEKLPMPPLSLIAVLRRPEATERTRVTSVPSGARGAA